MKLHEALTAMFAIIGQDMPDVGIAVMAKDLKGYPAASIGVALSRCRKELKRVSLKDILDRIPGGHPGPDEAWSMVAKALTDEGVSVVWTDEISQAFGVALNLSDDPIAARMAFKETYARLVAESREANKPLTWRPSLGHDKHGREPVLMDAVEKGRLTPVHAKSLLPNNPSDDVLARIESKVGPVAIGTVPRGTPKDLPPHPGPTA